MAKPHVFDVKSATVGEIQNVMAFLQSKPMTAEDGALRNACSEELAARRLAKAAKAGAKLLGL